LTLITTLFAFAIPPLVSQTVEFISFFSKQLVTTFSQIDTNINPADFINVNTLTQQIPNITTLVSNIVLGFFGNILNILSIFFFTLYFLMGIEKLEVFATKFLNKNQQTFFSETLKNVEKQLGAWMRAEILLMFVIGLLSYFGLVALGVKYALPLAVIAGLFEIFPIVGPIISVFPAFFVAASSSWVLSLLVIGLYIIIQQLENNLIVPYVMKKAVGIPPLAVLIALFIGQRVAGVWGIVLAVPITATLIIIVKEVFLYRQSTTE
jgi:predicted PurR-regulated permease PerM